ncbi:MULTISPECIES: 4Fe-4S binding protein [unclassified Fusibacter]|uniref:4Fe-4S binding protein n=1 Tax=unclassified Fusibacter TaxID=2624464 RepID=UPI001010ABD3|nr:MULTISPECIES: 4Fe-4S binding protein [unclassified Fusibacter]MCK8060435.1 4Fe-4S binding protein [Fusibacter sp. A2]NPE20276.1 4Fe-4S binding protein [Fusibacter sp. A1]RXV63482.1 4Fe-4S binding protein [Fusibacter sp. A1]
MKIKNKVRFYVQLFFFVFIALIVANHQLEDIGLSIPLIPTLSLHAICPFGGVETLYSLVTYNQYLPKLHESTIILFGLVMISSILFGPMLCSYLCPLGSIQEWVGKLGKRLFKSKYNNFIPRKLDYWMRYFRYFSLVAVVYLTAKSLTLVFLEVDPFYALFNFYTSEVAIGSILVLIATLGLSLFVERPWCKYACPYGALLGLTNLIRIFPIRRKEDSCTSCKLCDRNCPMNIEISTKSSIRDTGCIACHDCLSEVSCPIENTVVIEQFTKKG